MSQNFHWAAHYKRIYGEEKYHLTTRRFTLEEGSLISIRICNVMEFGALLFFCCIPVKMFIALLSFYQRLYQSSPSIIYYFFNLSAVNSSTIIFPHSGLLSYKICVHSAHWLKVLYNQSFFRALNFCLGLPTLPLASSFVAAFLFGASSSESDQLSSSLVFLNFNLFFWPLTGACFTASK